MNFTISTSPNLVSNVTGPLTVTSIIYYFAYYSNVILGLPINSYALWLICLRARSDIAAEIFSLNLTICEIVFSLNCLLCLVCNHMQVVRYITTFLVTLPTVGRPLINCLICVERYLAVLHPVSFLKFKPLRYRLACCAVIWVIVFAFCGLFAVYQKNMYVLICIFLSVLSIFLFIKLFCCLVIVRALKHPGPGEKGKDRKEANHMKKKAVAVILIITVSMFVQYGPLIITGFLYTIRSTGELFFSIGVSIFLMLGYVNPILYIYRVRNFQ